MAGRDSDDELRSRAGWSAPSSEPVRADERIATADRYEQIEDVATGGMGTVSVARDRRLGREVAIKRVAIESTDTDAAARLAREAAITARLEHPNIVAVYDAGVGEDGAPYYAMRLVRGRSLAEALRDGVALPTLLRHFLDACHAVAYAHGKGIAHCDLKPANVMVGELGETQVVDWGLARELVDATAGKAVATIAGTPAYLAPECRRGAAPDRSSDVWALGAILYELVTRERLREGRATVTPTELAAIVSKATNDEPAARYSDARSLANDVAAYVDGRRVAAYEYSSLELARRLIRAWRVPLGVLGAATLATLVIFGVMWRRVEHQRERALAAERAAGDALAATKSTLSWALDSTATSALANGAAAEAEIVAAHSLLAKESIDARGVLAAVRAGARPGPVEQHDMPGCPSIVIDDDTHALCVYPDAISRIELATQRQMWRTPVVTRSVVAGEGWIAATEAGVSVALLDPATGIVRAQLPFARPNAKLERDIGGRDLVVHDDRVAVGIDPVAGRAYDIGGPIDTTRICNRGAYAGTIDTIAVGQEELFAVCSDGTVLRVARGQAPSEIAHVPFGPQLKPASTSALDAAGKRLAVGGLGGELEVLSLAGGKTVAAKRVLDHAVARIAFLGAHLVIGGDHGPARVWSSDLVNELLALPAHASASFVLRGDALISSGRAWWRWQLPEALAPHVFQSAAGLSGAAVSDDGTWVAAARGDGVVEAWSTKDGRHSPEVKLSTAVIKRVDFSPDGAHLAAGISATTVSSAVIDTSTWQLEPHEAAIRGVARIAYLRDGLIGMHYGPDLSRWGKERDTIASPVFVDGARTADRTALWFLTGDGGVWKLRDGALEFIFSTLGARELSPANDGSVLLMGSTSATLHAGRDIEIVLPAGELPSSVALSADAAWAAIGTMSGTIYVWSHARGTIVAAMRGHGERVAWLSFAAGSLWSASWDGTIRRWSLDALELSPAALVADAERAWRMKLDDAL